MESPPLPPELFQMILELVDGKEALFPLLLVSRAFKALAEPLLFRDVVATTHDLRGLQGFYLRVTAENDRLSSYVHSLTTSITVNSVSLGDRKTAALDAILARLRNLKRLNLLYHWEPFIAFPSLAPTTYPFSLTHFACSNNVQDIEAFAHFLEAQPSLEHLSLSSVDSAVSLAPSALPRLRVLQAPLVFAVSVMSGRKISHLLLNTPVFDVTIKTDAETHEAFDNLRSLHCVADDLLKLAPLVSNIRCVWLMLRSVGILEDFLPITEALATMHIQYLRLSGFKPGGNHSNFVDQLYEENRFLRSIDLKRSYPSEYSRYTVGKSFPVKVDVGASAFDEWWLHGQACQL